MTNIKRIESQTMRRLKILSSVNFWALDIMNYLRRNEGHNELRKAIIKALKRYRPFGIKSGRMDIIQDSWESDRRERKIYFSFFVEAKEPLYGMCEVNLYLPDDYDDDDPDSKRSQKALDSNVKIACSVFIVDENGEQISHEEEFPLDANISYGDLLEFY